MHDVRWSRLVRTVAGAAAGSALLAACSTAGTMSALSPHAPAPDRAVGTDAGSATIGVADEQMPVAPRGETAWLHAVARAYAGAGRGEGAEQWLRRRMAHRRAGERLAVVMGVDDVMVQTHFGGLDALVPRSVRFVRAAHALGYAVFYVTGRSAASGLGRVEATLRRAHVPATAFYGSAGDGADLESAKAEARASIEQRGYTLAMSVAASEASFDGSPRAEQEIRLPDFALRG